MRYIVEYFDGESQSMAERTFDRVDDALRFHADKFISNLIPFHGPHPTIKEAEVIKHSNVDLSYLK